MKKNHFFQVVLFCTVFISVTGCDFNANSFEKSISESQDGFALKEIDSEGITYSINGSEEETLSKIDMRDRFGCFRFDGYEYKANVSNGLTHSISIYISGLDTVKKVHKGSKLSTLTGNNIYLLYVYYDDLKFYEASLIDDGYLKIIFVEWGGTGGRARGQFEGKLVNIIDGDTLKIKGEFYLPIDLSYEENKG